MLLGEHPLETLKSTSEEGRLRTRQSAPEPKKNHCPEEIKKGLKEGERRDEERG